MSTTPDAKVRRPRSRAQKQKTMEQLANGSDATDNDALGVQAFERGLAVIRAFVNQDRALTISDVAEITQLSRATVRRLLGSLVRLHYARTDGQSFQLTPTILELGYAYLSSNQFWERVQPYMHDVVRELNESCSLGILELPNVVYVARVPAQRIVLNIAINIGTKIPASVSSMGRLLLAYQPRDVVLQYLEQHPLQAYTPRSVTDTQEFLEILDRAQADGWVLVDEEMEIGLRSIAVPLRNRRGDVIAAMNVGAPTSRASVEHMVSRFLPVIREAANRANHALSLG